VNGPTRALFAPSPELVRSYAESPERQRQLYRRTLWIVATSQVFGGLGLAAGITVGALLAEDMLGTDRLAGLPLALATAGSAAAALLIGRFSQRIGRRNGLTLGFLAGSIGAAGVVFAAVTDNVVVLFAALVVYGSGTASNLQARYAGTDLAGPRQRGTAVSVALVATTLGAVAGPNLVTVTGDFAIGYGIPALAGPFMLAFAGFLLAALVFFVLLRPDPLLISRALDASASVAASAVAPPSAPPSAPAAGGVGAPLTALSTANRGVVVGATVMVLTQIAMVAIMTMTPVHMRAHGHALGEVGVVISVHVAAMFLPSLVTGVLVDRVGRLPMAIASGVTLLAAGLLAAAAPADSLPVLVVALALLGLGWNFGLISGTAMLVDSTTPANRAQTQGAVDVLIALSGATGGALSGVVVAGSSFAVLSLGGGILALLLIPVVVWSRRG
jgi:MFS family permease